LLGARHTTLAQQALCGFHVAVRVLQRTLDVHHRSLCLGPKLLDECSADDRHSAGTSSGAGSAAVSASASATGSSPGDSCSVACCSSAGPPFLAAAPSAGVAPFGPPA